MLLLLLPIFCAVEVLVEASWRLPLPYFVDTRLLCPLLLAIAAAVLAHRAG
jgi:hypothetical protein